MANYRKTARKRPRIVPPHKVRMKGDRVRVNLKRLPWWMDPVVQRILGWRRQT
jgi:hypothetical protein